MRDGAIAIDCNRPVAGPTAKPSGMFASTDRVELAALWDELVAGTCKIDGWSHGSSTWSMWVARPPRTKETQALRQRDVEILKQALLCGVRKRVAVANGLSGSSVAVILQGCLQFMGLRCVPSRMPGLLVAAAHARYHRGLEPSSSSSRDRTMRRCMIQTITVPRPDRALAAWLAPSEHAVLSLLIEGQCYAEIARARRTSVRTVANQLASGFRRLGVSSRAELLCLLARWGLESPQPPVPRQASVFLAPTRSAHSRRSSRRDEARGRADCLAPSPAT